MYYNMINSFSFVSIAVRKKPNIYINKGRKKKIRPRELEIRLHPEQFNQSGWFKRRDEGTARLDWVGLDDDGGVMVVEKPFKYFNGPEILREDNIV